eukprot:Skav221773  [mRNA]  locus=scaffold490:489534:489752:- [translate_table: standard]
MCARLHCLPCRKCLRMQRSIVYNQGQDEREERREKTEERKRREEGHEDRKKERGRGRVSEVNRERKSADLTT